MSKRINTRQNAQNRGVETKIDKYKERRLTVLFFICFTMLFVSLNIVSLTDNAFEKRMD